MPLAGVGGPCESFAGMVIIVYGYEGSGPGHWQRWLETELQRRGVRVLLPELPEPAAPQKDAWVAALADIIAAHGAPPLTFVCHSLGCWALDHLLAERGVPTARAALLAAPPSPYLVFDAVDSFFPPPRRRAAWAPLAARTLVVGSDNDDFASAEELAGLAAHLGTACKIIPGAGHLNPASGYGPWPFALEWALANTA
jgi:predicted alpha/beta hydrolase family esterase